MFTALSNLSKRTSWSKSWWRSPLWKKWWSTKCKFPFEQADCHLCYAGLKRSLRISISKKRHGTVCSMVAASCWDQPCTIAQSWAQNETIVDFLTFFLVPRKCMKNSSCFPCANYTSSKFKSGWHCLKSEKPLLQLGGDVKNSKYNSLKCIALQQVFKFIRICFLLKSLKLHYQGARTNLVTAS